MMDVAAVTWFTPLQGGIPITVGKQIVGGVGVSGASSAQQDEEVAIAGAVAIQDTTAATNPKADVIHIPAASQFTTLPGAGKTARRSICARAALCTEFNS